MLKELREGLLKWHKATELAYECLEFDISEFNDNGMYSDMGAICERNTIFRIYFDVICRDIDLDDREAVLNALKVDRAKMQNFLDVTTKNMTGHCPNDIYCAEQALCHYDELINEIEFEQ